MLDLFSTPYPLGETIGMIRRRFSPPPPRSMEHAVRDCVIDPEHPPDDWLGFVGDISPLQGRSIRYDPDIEQFFSDCSNVVGNLEGVITDQPWFPYLHNHTVGVFETLAALTPLDRWVLSVANNHALDYGPRALTRTVKECMRRGVRYFGTSDLPRVSIRPDITVTSWTWWVNRDGDGVARSDPGDVPEDGLHVAYPHWGYEHERRPRSIQRNRLPRAYSAVIGHHSHLPQPLELCDEDRPVAWSLGNFITAKQLPVLGEGAIVKLGISHADESPRVTRVVRRDIRIERPLRKEFCAVVPMSSS